MRASLLVLALLLAGCSTQPDPDAGGLAPTPSGVPTGAPPASTSPAPATATPPPTATPAPSPPAPPTTPPPTTGWTMRPCALPEAPAPGLPDLALVVWQENASEGALARRYDFVEGRYVLAAQSAVTPSPTPLGQFPAATLEGAAYLQGIRASANGTAIPSLWRLDGQMRPVANASGEAYDLAAWNGTLFATSHELRAFDAALRPLDALELPLKMGRDSVKAAHDLLVQDGVAYMLDDVIYPLFVLKADVSDPTDLRLTLHDSVSGLNVWHLYGHWVEPDGTWIIRGDMGLRNVFTFSPEEARGFATFGPSPFASIAAQLEEPSPWALLRENGTVTLVDIALDLAAGRASSCLYPLAFQEEATVHQPTGLRRVDGLVFGHWGSELFVVDDRSDPPRLVHRQRLDASVAALAGSLE